MNQILFELEKFTLYKKHNHEMKNYESKFMHPI